MAYFIYLHIHMNCRLDFDRPTDSSSPVTSSHRAIPRWAWHIGGLWVGFHIIEGSPDDLVLLLVRTYSSSGRTEP